MNLRWQKLKHTAVIDIMVLHTLSTQLGTAQAKLIEQYRMEVPGTSMAAAWYLRKSSLPLAERLPMVTPKVEPRGYPPMNASGNTTNCAPYVAASAINFSALSAITS